jgi:hypothetical protein
MPDRAPPMTIAHDDRDCHTAANAKGHSIGNDNRVDCHGARSAKNYKKSDRKNDCHRHRGVGVFVL